MIIAGILLLIILIAFLCIEKGKNRKINISPLKSGIIYLMFPLVYSITMCAGIMLMYSSFLDTTDEALNSFIDSGNVWDFIKNNVDWDFIVSFIIQAVISVPVTVLSFTGAIASVHRNCSENEDKQKWTRLPFAASVISTVSAVTAIIFTCIVIIVFLGGTAYISLLVFVILIILVVFTLGLFLIAAVFAVPIYLAGVGFYMIITCLPLIISAYIWCCCFTVLHVISAAMSFYVFIRLKKDGIFTTGNMVLNCILSLIPIVNIFASINASSKIRICYNK